MYPAMVSTLSPRRIRVTASQRRDDPPNISSVTRDHDQSRRSRPRQDRFLDARIEMIDLRGQVLVQRDELAAALRRMRR